MALRPRALVFLLTTVSALAAAGPAAAAGDDAVAALQVGLRAKGVYAGTIDGVLGPETTEAVRKLQRRTGLAVDGIPGASTKRALGKYGRPELGKRMLSGRVVGWDVAQLQFRLAWHGFPSGPLDGRFGPRTEAAVRRFQEWAGLVPDGAAGPATLIALRTAPPASPVALGWPLGVPYTDVFGPRGNRFHTGLDFPAPAGTPVASAGAGQVTYAGHLKGGWGLVVTVAHGNGVRTMYAHLSKVEVKVGAEVAAGARLGAVGATGQATGPHLHFEVRLRGAAIDPLTALQ
jgi:peptidoglycan hydrolase-like protein with peptidoglycan-binding domain